MSPRAETAAMFAYGSLVDATSAAETLGPGPDRRAGLATLRGWRRGFTLARDNRASEKTFELADGTVPDHVLALNVHRSGSGSVNGVVIELTDEELSRLDDRELRYRRVEVTAEVDSDMVRAATTVYAYVAKPENLALRPPLGAVILRSYAEAVESAFAALGEAQLAAYRRSVRPHPAPVVEARLVRDSIPPGNPRRW